MTRFRSELDGAAGGSGLSDREVVRRLAEVGVFLSNSAYGNWRTGRAMPHANADTRDLLLALERVLEAAPGRLVVALHDTVGRPGVLPSRRSGRPPQGLAGSRAALERRIEETSVGNRGRLALVEQAERYYLGPDGRPLRSTVTYRLVALRPGVDRYWCVHTVEHASPVELRPRAHCQLGRVLQESGDGHTLPVGYEVAGAELLFDHPLVAGELYEFKFSLENRPGPADAPPPEPEYGRVVLDPGCRRLRLRIVFDSGRMPAEVRQVTWKRESAGGRPATEELVPLSRRYVELNQRDPRPIAYGFRWSWLEDR